MYAILMTFIAFVVLRLLIERKPRDGMLQHVGTVVGAEARAWLLIAAILIGACILLFAFALLVGPIPEIHEW